jgi:hypothetical protein
LLMARSGSLTQVQRTLETEGESFIPSRKAIMNVYDKFCKFGTVLDLPKSGRPPIPVENSTELIQEILEANPKSTISQLSAATGVSRATVSRRISSDIRMKSYKIQIHQELFEDDYDRRVEMAEALLPILQNPSYKDLIFFSDEATFYLSGRVHKQNCRIWGFEKPNGVAEEPLYPEKVNV